MSTISRTAILALTTATIALTAFVPVASAHDRGRDRDARPAHHHAQAMRGAPGRTGLAQRGPGGMLDIACSARGAERIDMGLLRLSYRVDLTAEQRTLFDDMRTAALAAQAAFAENCAAARPAPADTAATTRAAPLDPVEQMKTRLEIAGARVEAMQTVLPSFEAFYGSLTDEQKAALTPRRQHMGQAQPERMEPRMDRRERGDRPGRMDREGRGERDGRGHGRQMPMPGAPT